MTAGAFAGLAPCVHCGFCLQSCPTYLVTGDEADSPRGRILLLRALEHGELPPHDRALIHHVDRCLGCRACEPVCPSGVSYAPALEEARRRFAEVRPTPAAVRLVLTVMAEPLVRAPLLALARLVRPVATPLARMLGATRVGFLAGMLAATNGSDRRIGGSAGRRGAGPAGLGLDRALSRSTEPPTRRSAVIFRGCIMDGLFSHVHRATARTLAVNGYTLVAAPGQTCCGALHAHAGFEEDARALARRNVAALGRAGADRIVVNAAGCGAALKEYGRLLAGDPLEPAARAVAARVRDVTEALAETGPRPGAPVPLSVAYDPPCHLLHAQRITHEPLAVLDAVPGLRRVPLDEAELCCGSAGSYSLSEPELSREIIARKVAAIERANPDVVATGNPGCVMQIGAGLRTRGLAIPVVHPVEILDQSYRAAGLLARAES
ncbi:MAG TPA: heterodisulfide reductase-related iron-sulfur binding cluster [Gemmatimonadales bacterium]|nr:heterodisulfide reductase-related iron-sulfur binding cluster [Gemmatimonadales bacterium]